MSDNEIIKALECCSTGKSCYDVCPFDDKFGITSCTKKLSNAALDLINRQQAEIERLKKNIDGLNIFTKNHIKVIRLQAIKEFAKRLKEKLQWDVEFDNKLVFESDIDNLVKEMTESEKILHKINHNSLCETETFNIGS